MAARRTAGVRVSIIIAGANRRYISICDFELTTEEVASISALDRGEAAVTDSDVFGH